MRGVGKICKIGLRLQLITNKKSYIGFRLATKSMTLDDPERQNRGLWTFWRFRAATHISRANCAEITTDRPVQPALAGLSCWLRYKK